MCAALTEYDVARHNELRGSLFRAESFARALGGFVGAAFRSVRGGAEKVEREERKPLE